MIKEALIKEIRRPRSATTQLGLRASCPHLFLIDKNILTHYWLKIHLCPLFAGHFDTDIGFIVRNSVSSLIASITV